MYMRSTLGYGTLAGHSLVLPFSRWLKQRRSARGAGVKRQGAPGRHGEPASVLQLKPRLLMTYARHIPGIYQYKLEILYNDPLDHFAGEKCVLPGPQYIERPGADNLFATGIMRPAHHNSHALAVNSNAPQALGFRCVNCKAEFGSRVAMACHSRHPTSIGTPCEDPKDAKSISLAYTGRASVLSSIVREHDTVS